MEVPERGRRPVARAGGSETRATERPASPQARVDARGAPIRSARAGPPPPAAHPRAPPRCPTRRGAQPERGRSRGGVDAQLRGAPGRGGGRGCAGDQERGDRQEQPRRVERDAPVQPQLREARQVRRREAPEHVLAEPGQRETERRAGAGEELPPPRPGRPGALAGSPRAPSAPRAPSGARRPARGSRLERLAVAMRRSTQSRRPEQEQPGPVRADPLVEERADAGRGELGVLLRVARREVGGDVRQLLAGLGRRWRPARGGR